LSEASGELQNLRMSPGTGADGSLGKALTRVRARIVAEREAGGKATSPRAPAKNDEWVIVDK
jgi:hypothetical protein